MKALAKVTETILTSDQRWALIQLVEAARACENWSVAKMRVDAKRDIESAASLDDLQKETAIQIVTIADQMLQNGNLKLEGIEALAGMISTLRKTHEMPE